MKPVIHADFDEVVFADRNQQYGAFILRKSEPRNLGLALLFTITGFGLFLVTPRVLAMLFPQKPAQAMRGVVIDIDPSINDGKRKKKQDIIPVKPEEKKPDRPKIATIAVLIPEPVPPAEVKDTTSIAENDALKGKAVSTHTQAGTDGTDYFTGDFADGDGEIPDMLLDEPIAEPPIDIVIFGADEPTPVNMDDIRKLIGYPQIARDGNIQGDVVLRVLIDERGTYVKHKVIKQMHPVLAQAVEKFIHRLRFTPAIQGGKPIKFWVNVPFRFKLQQ